MDEESLRGPVITVRTITLQGDANGASHPDASVCAGKFRCKYARRIIRGAIGHNLPQAFTGAIVDLTKS